MPLVRIGLPKVNINGKASAMDMQLMGARLDYFHAPTSSWKHAVEDSELSVSLILEALVHARLFIVRSIKPLPARWLPYTSSHALTLSCDPLCRRCRSGISTGLTAIQIRRKYT